MSPTALLIPDSRMTAKLFEMLLEHSDVFGQYLFGLVQDCCYLRQLLYFVFRELLLHRLKNVVL